jgi:hypothetical protein
LNLTDEADCSQLTETGAKCGKGVSRYFNASTLRFDVVQERMSLLLRGTPLLTGRGISTKPS